MMHLYRIGTDPEFVFATLVDGVAQLVSAQKVISANKELTLKSFIGTDGHASTAELRPTPSNNVNRVMYEIASAMDHIGKFLSSKPKWSGTTAMAHPIVAGERLGGHIHASFWVNDPLFYKIAQHGYMYSHGTFFKLPQFANYKDVPTAWTAEVHNRQETQTADNEYFNPIQFVRVFDWLLKPLDMWVQNEVLRASRMQGGSHVEEPFRVNYSKPNATLAEGRFKGQTYMHIEYRSPSTWLTHPWLAYAYLGLGKFTMLNYDRISRASFDPPKKQPKPTTAQHYAQLTVDPWHLEGTPKQKAPVSANSGANRELFMHRMDDLMTGGARLTSDLDDLDMAFAKIDKWRERWVNPSTPININAWRKLL